MKTVQFKSTQFYAWQISSKRLNLGESVPIAIQNILSWDYNTVLYYNKDFYTGGKYGNLGDWVLFDENIPGVQFKIVSDQNFRKQYDILS